MAFSAGPVSTARRPIIAPRISGVSRLPRAASRSPATLANRASVSNIRPSRSKTTAAIGEDGDIGGLALDLDLDLDLKLYLTWAPARLRSHGSAGRGRSRGTAPPDPGCRRRRRAGG